MPPPAGKPPDFCRDCRSIRASCPRRPALGLAQRVRQRAGEALLLVRPETCGNRQPPAMRDQEQPLDAEFLVHDAVELHPDRVERPFAHAAAMADLAQRELGRGDGDLLIGARRCGNWRGTPNRPAGRRARRSRTPATRRSSRRPRRRQNLSPPMQSMKIRKPRGPSERCGVMTAEKIFGSLTAASRLLSLFMALIIGETWGGDIWRARNPKRNPSHPPSHA